MTTVSRLTGQTVHTGDSVYDQRTGDLVVYERSTRANNGHDGQVVVNGATGNAARYGLRVHTE